MFFGALLIVFQLVFEALPVSSSGHLFLAELFFRSRKIFLDTSSFPEFFDHLLQAPFLIVVMVLFFREWSNPFRCLFSSLGFGGRKDERKAKKLWAILLKIMSFIFISDLMTGIFYFIFHLGIKPFMGKEVEPFFLLVGFILTMSALFSLKFFQSLSGSEKLDFRKATILGIVQGLAVFPGISRFAFTYVAGRWLKLSSRRAFQISFLIGFPVNIVGPLKGLWHLSKYPGWQSIFTWKLSLAIIAAAVLSFFLLRFARNLALRTKLWWFGFYMILPISFLIIFVLIK